jgi:hypothetical protein
MTFIHSTALFTLRRVGWHCPSNGEGPSFEPDRVEPSYQSRVGPIPHSILDDPISRPSKLNERKRL